MLATGGPGHPSDQAGPCPATGGEVEVEVEVEPVAFRRPRGRRAAYAVARHLFPPRAARSARVRHAILRHTVRRLARSLEGTPMEGRLWLMGGLAIGYARNGAALPNDLTDIDFGYDESDYDAMLATVDVLARRGFERRHLLVSNAGVPTAMRLNRHGVWIDLLRCFRRGDREYWIGYATDRYSADAPREVEVETEVRLQPKVPTVPPLYGTTWLHAEDLSSWIREQYGDWTAPDFLDRPWNHVRDCPAVVRCEPWQGRWEPWR